MPLMTVPGLAGLKDAVRSFKGSVNAVDVLVGVAAGIVGGKLIKKVIDQKLGMSTTGAPMLDINNGFGKYVSQYGESIGAILTGGALFAVQKGNNRAKGHFVGAAGAAVVLPIADKLSTEVNKALKFGDYVTFPGSYGQLRNDFGQLVNDPTQFGALYQDKYGDYTALPGSLGDLAATSAMTAESDEYNVY